MTALHVASPSHIGFFAWCVDGGLHWSQSVLEDSSALSVEISSYVLLAVLNQVQLSAAHLGYANRIVSWLVKQQNPYGGFSSTQVPQYYPSSNKHGF